MELLPAIDILGAKAVRLAKGNYDAVTVYNQDPVEQAHLFEEAGARWVHVVDLDGARLGKPVNTHLIEAIVKDTHLQVEVGGGIRDLAAIDRLACAGASRIVLGTSLVTDETFAAQALTRYGDVLTAGVDAKNGEVAVAGWEKGSGLSAEEFVAHVAALGFKHMVYTDIAKDGMQTGIDASAYVQIAQIFGRPVIASGGVADIDDIKALLQVESAIAGVIAGRAVYEKTLDLPAALKLCSIE